MPESSSLEVTLNALFAPDFVPDGPVAASVEGLQAILPPPESVGRARIHDARELQARAAHDPHYSDAAFFEEHGFVLLDHESEVSSWDLDAGRPEAEQDPVRVYHPEAEALVRERLLPGRKLEVYQGPPVRRGPGTANPTYAAGVHQDNGLTPDDFEEGLRAFTNPEISGWWRERFDRDDVLGFQLIDFWRPVQLEGPLRHMPLAVCEPRSVRIEDCVPLRLQGLTPTGLPTNQLGLRAHPDQRWWYYPGMTRSEVLAFKNYQYTKGRSGGRVEACFHTAFWEPGCPVDEPPRQSCEHRVSVFVLR